MIIIANTTECDRKWRGYSPGKEASGDGLKSPQKAIPKLRGSGPIQTIHKAT